VTASRAAPTAHRPTASVSSIDPANFDHYRSRQQCQIGAATPAWSAIRATARLIRAGVGFARFDLATRSRHHIATASSNSVLRYQQRSQLDIKGIQQHHQPLAPAQRTARWPRSWSNWCTSVRLAQRRRVHFASKHFTLARPPDWGQYSPASSNAWNEASTMLGDTQPSTRYCPAHRHCQHSVTARPRHYPHLEIDRMQIRYSSILPRRSLRNARASAFTGPDPHD
jgi:hypothetical protein